MQGTVRAVARTGRPPALKWETTETQVLTSNIRSPPQETFSLVSSGLLLQHQVHHFPRWLGRSWTWDPRNHQTSRSIRNCSRRHRSCVHAGRHGVLEARRTAGCFLAVSPGSLICHQTLRAGARRPWLRLFEKAFGKRVSAIGPKSIGDFLVGPARYA